MMSKWNSPVNSELNFNLFIQGFAKKTNLISLYNIDIKEVQKLSAKTDVISSGNQIYNNNHWFKNLMPSLLF